MYRACGCPTHYRMDVQPPNKLASWDRIQISPLAKHQLKHPYLLIFETLLQQIFSSSVTATKIPKFVFVYQIWQEVDASVSCGNNSTIPGGVLLGILCGVVRPSSPNPGAISDQRMSFFTPVFRPDLKNPYLFSDLTFRQELCHHYLD